MGAARSVREMIDHVRKMEKDRRRQGAVCIVLVIFMDIDAYQVFGIEGDLRRSSREKAVSGKKKFCDVQGCFFRRSEEMTGNLS